MIDYVFTHFPLDHWHDHRGSARLSFPDLAQSPTVPDWPPDAFALAASLLLESGAYMQVVAKWPPTGTQQDGCLQNESNRWAQQIRDIGRKWQEGWREKQIPPEVNQWWSIIQAHADVSLHAIGREGGTPPRICQALLQLCAAADEASRGVGTPMQKDHFIRKAESRLVPDPKSGSTLCSESVHWSKVRVLPKGHTPQNGITLGSLSRNLALWPTGDVQPFWYTVPPRDLSYLATTFSLNMLLVPWPKMVTPVQFQPAKPVSGQISNMPSSFGFFTYNKTSDPAGLLTRLNELYEAAVKIAGRIEMVVFPELALDAIEYNAVRGWASEHKVLLICGVGEPSSGESPGKNYVAVEIPISTQRSTPVLQYKHHRWRLDKSQIVQYGLGGQLDPERQWWEHTANEARNLTFVSVLPWLSLCVLICEDLARQEPVARLVRAVGPNLVIALLMDGPQLDSRWPARYATVLAEDPGSSVLTLTSIGMAELSRPPGKPPSRTIGLWKDAKSGAARQIDLPSGSDGLVLNLARQLDEEWSADGRSDGKTAGYPILGGIHPVVIKGS